MAISDGKKIVRVFISAAADVSAERTDTEMVLKEIEQGLAGRVTFDLVSWEDLPPVASAGLQSFANCELVLGIFGKNTRSEAETDAQNFDTVFQDAMALGEDGELQNQDIYVYRQISSGKKKTNNSFDKMFDSWFSSSVGNSIATLHQFTEQSDFRKGLRRDLLNWLARQRKLPWNVDQKGPPFRGLNSYEIEDEAIFFGRDVELKRAQALINSSIYNDGSGGLLLVGSKGSGKSSFAHAGVLPAMLRPGGLPDIDFARAVVISPGELGDDPLQNLADIFFNAADPAHILISFGGQNPGYKFSNEVDSDGFKTLLDKSPEIAAAEIAIAQSNWQKTIHDAQNGTPDVADAIKASVPQTAFVFIIDQLENISAWNPSEQKGFVEFISAVSHQENCFVVGCQTKGQKSPTDQYLYKLGDSLRRFELPRLNRKGIEGVLTSSAKLAWFQFEDGLKEAILKESNQYSQSDLSLTLLTLFGMREGEDNQVTLAHYETIGGIAGCYSYLADDTVLGLSKNQADEAELELALINLAGELYEQVEIGEFKPKSEVSTFSGKQLEILQALSAKNLIDFSNGEPFDTALFIEKWPMLKEAAALHFKPEPIEEDELEAEAIVLDSPSEPIPHQPIAKDSDIDKPETIDDAALKQDELGEMVQAEERSEPELASGSKSEQNVTADFETSAEAEDDTATPKDFGPVDEAESSESKPEQNAFLIQPNTVDDEKQVALDNSYANLVLSSAETNTEEVITEVERDVIDLSDDSFGDGDVPENTPGEFFASQMQDPARKFGWVSAFLLILFLGASGLAFYSLSGWSNSESKIAGLQNDVGEAISARTNLIAKVAEQAVQDGDLETARHLVSAALPKDLSELRTPSSSQSTLGSLSARIYALDSIYRIINAHEETIRNVAFSPDGLLLASGSSDGVVKLWDPVTGRGIGTYEGLGETVTSLKFGPIGNILAVGTQDGFTRLWDIKNGVEVSQIGGHKGAVTDITFSPNGKALAIAANDGAAVIWNLDSGKIQGQFKAEVNFAFDSLIGPRGQLLLTAGPGRNSQLWDARSGEKTVELSGHAAEVDTATFSADGSVILTGSWDGTARLWDPASGANITTFTGHGGSVLDVELSADKRYALTGSVDGSAKLWDVATGKELKSFDGHGSAVVEVSFRPDGGGIATGTSNGSVWLWEVDLGQSLVRLKGLDSKVEAVATSADGRLVITATTSGIGSLWNTNDGTEIVRFQGHEGAIEKIRLSPNGVNLITAGADGTSRIWEIGTGAELNKISGTAGQVNAVTFQSDGQGLFAQATDGAAQIWNVSSGIDLISLGGHLTPIIKMAFSPNGKHLATGEANGLVYIWHVGTGQKIAELSADGGALTELVFESNGSRIAIASGELVEYFDTGSGSKISSLAGHVGGVLSLGVSPDGETIATSMSDQSVRLWSAVTGRESIRMGLDYEVSAIAFTTNGKSLITGTTTGSTRYWRSLIVPELAYRGAQLRAAISSNMAQNTKDLLGIVEGTSPTQNTLAEECSALAAHPFDPENRSLGFGIAEADLDENRAIETCAQAHEKNDGDVSVHYQLARAELKLGRTANNAEVREVSLSQGLANLKEAAEAGSAIASYTLASLDETDPVEKIQLATTAFEAGVLPAAWLVHELYVKGEGVEKNITKALEWLRKGEVAGDPYSIYQLAALHYQGDDLFLRSKVNPKNFDPANPPAISQAGLAAPTLKKNDNIAFVGAAISVEVFEKYGAERMVFANRPMLLRANLARTLSAKQISTLWDSLKEWKVGENIGVMTANAGN